VFCHHSRVRNLTFKVPVTLSPQLASGTPDADLSSPADHDNAIGRDISPGRTLSSHHNCRYDPLLATVDANCKAEQSI
jgi:hypothetical protein